MGAWRTECQKPAKRADGGCDFSEASTSRKPLGGRGGEPCFIKSGMAQANASFQIDCDHVESNKEIYKSGESEYRINNKICRLKDVRELSWIPA